MKATPAAITWRRYLDDDLVLLVRVQVIEIEKTSDGFCATVKGAEGTLAATGATRDETVKVAHELILDSVNWALNHGKPLDAVLGAVPHGVYKIVVQPRESKLPTWGPWAMTQAPIYAHATA